MIKCVILDAGGVICLPRMGSWLITPRFEEIIGKTRLDAATPARTAAVMTESARIYLDESMPITDEAVEFAARRNYFLDVAKRLSWTLTDREADALARDMTENDARYDFYGDARQGVIALGEEYRLGLLSDAMISLKRVFFSAGYLELFDAAALSCEVGAVKPDPRMYETILEMLDCPPDECVFIDDKPGNVLGAEKAGMRGLLMAREDAPRWDGLWAADLFQAKKIIDKMN